jgi:transcription elongation factor Elf1
MIDFKLYSSGYDGFAITFECPKCGFDMSIYLDKKYNVQCLACKKKYRLQLVEIEKEG